MQIVFVSNLLFFSVFLGGSLLKPIKLQHVAIVGLFVLAANVAEFKPCSLPSRCWLHPENTK